MGKVKRFTSLHDYLDRTGTNQQQLLALVREKTGHVISPALFSYILRGSRRWSRMNAFAVACATGLPMEVVMARPSHDSDQLSGKGRKEVA